MTKQRQNVFTMRVDGSMISYEQAKQIANEKISHAEKVGEREYQETI